MLAWALILLGAVLEAWTVAELGWRRWLGMTDAPPDPALPRAVFGGPFGIVRHPQCLGFLLLLAGVAAASSTTAMWFAAGVLAACGLVLAYRSERRMAADFGEAYDRYRRSVPFIVPRSLLPLPADFAGRGSRSVLAAG